MKDRSVFPEFSRRQFLGFGAVTAAAVGVTMAVGGELRGQSRRSYHANKASRGMELSSRPYEPVYVRIDRFR